MGHLTPDTRHMSELRTTSARIVDTLEVLARNGDGWLATASPDGGTHLIAVSACWSGGAVLLATRSDSLTARNLTATGSARLALGVPADAVLLDVAMTERPALRRHLGRARCHLHGRDGLGPGRRARRVDYFVLAPRRVQAYRGYGERPGATIMRDGRWLD